MEAIFFLVVGFNNDFKMRYLSKGSCHNLSFLSFWILLPNPFWFYFFTQIKSNINEHNFFKHPWNLSSLIFFKEINLMGYVTGDDLSW